MTAPELDRAAMMKALDEQDDTAMLALADWHEEHGDTATAGKLRWLYHSRYRPRQNKYDGTNNVEPWAGKAGWWYWCETDADNPYRYYVPVKHLNVREWASTWQDSRQHAYPTRSQAVYELIKVLKEQL